MGWYNEGISINTIFMTPSKIISLGAIGLAMVGVLVAASLGFMSWDNALAVLALGAGQLGIHVNLPTTN